MTKIAIISDIHANKTALEATLADIKHRGCDQIFCLGDTIAKGKFPNECVDLVKKHCVVSVRGNCDDYFATDRADFTKLEQAAHDQITPENREYLQNLPYCHEFYLSGRFVRLFHAAPDSMYNYTHTSLVASFDQKYQMFEPNALTLSDQVADLVVYGHIHTQLMTKIYNRTLICAGSVGNNLDLIRDGARDGDPLNTTAASYVILEGELDSRKHSDLSVNFVQVSYDIDKEIAASHIAEDSYLYLELKNGQYRDTEKLSRILAGEVIGTKDKKLKND